MSWTAAVDQLHTRPVAQGANIPLTPQAEKVGSDGVCQFRLIYRQWEVKHRGCMDITEGGKAQNDVR
ncbi:MAG: hypothetical protein R2864_09020 [Syntrophotaleaceae bacterium]